jgi:hypothetical protein
LLSSFSIDQFSAAHPISLTGLRLLRINVMLILLHLEPESAERQKSTVSLCSERLTRVSAASQLQLLLKSGINP